MKTEKEIKAIIEAIKNLYKEDMPDYYKGYYRGYEEAFKLVLMDFIEK